MASRKTGHEMPHILLPTGTKLYYEFWSGGHPVNDIDARRPTIVLIHACLSDSTQWSNQLSDPRLGMYNFVTFDSKFHGRSTGPLKPGFTYRDGARDIATAMDILKVPRAHFVGESYGARRVIHLAVDRPDLVSSLMLISPGVFGEEPDDHQGPIRELKEAMMETNRQYAAGNIPKTECRFPDEVSMGYVYYHFGETLDREALQREISHINRAYACVPPEVSAELLDAYLKKQPIGGLDTVKQPVLLLRGSKNVTEDPSIACDMWKEAFCNSSNLEFHVSAANTAYEILAQASTHLQMIHGAPLRATAALPFLVTRFMIGWLRKNSHIK